MEAADVSWAWYVGLEQLLNGLNVIWHKIVSDLC